MSTEKEEILTHLVISHDVSKEGIKPTYNEIGLRAFHTKHHWSYTLKHTHVKDDRGRLIVSAMIPETSGAKEESSILYTLIRDILVDYQVWSVLNIPLVDDIVYFESAEKYLKENPEMVEYANRVIRVSRLGKD